MTSCTQKGSFNSKKKKKRKKKERKRKKSDAKVSLQSHSLTLFSLFSTISVVEKGERKKKEWLKYNLVWFGLVLWSGVGGGRSSPEIGSLFGPFSFQWNDSGRRNFSGERSERKKKEGDEKKEEKRRKKKEGNEEKKRRKEGRKEGRKEERQAEVVFPQKTSGTNNQSKQTNIARFAQLLTVVFWAMRKRSNWASSMVENDQA